MHGVVVLREHHRPILESLRHSIMCRRNVRLEFGNVSQVAVVGVNANSSPQQVLQAANRAHDGEPLLVHVHPPLFRTTKGTAQKPMWLMAHFFHLDANLKLSGWDLRKKLAERLSNASRNISTSYPSFGWDKATPMATRSCALTHAATCSRFHAS